MPSPQWSAPRTVAFLQFAFTVPRIAGLGDSVVGIWDQMAQDGVQVSRLGADSVWQPAHRIGPSDSTQASVGVDRAGRAVAAWVGPDPEPMPTRLRQCVWGASSDSAGNWTDAVPLACDVFFLRLAVGPAGDAAVVWSSRFDPEPPTGSSRSSLWSARYRPDEGWSDLRAITFGLRPSSVFDQADFGVAMDENGVAAVAWDELPGRFDSARIHLATGRAGEPWRMSILFGPGSGLRDARVAFESPGIPVVAWRGVGGGVQSMRVTAGTNFPNTITSNSGDTCIRIAGSGRGTSTVTWWRQDAADGIWAASLQGGPPEQLRGFPRQGVRFCPVVAVDEAGNAVIAWEEHSTERAGEVWASVRRGPTGAWSQAALLADEGGSPTVAIAKDVAYVVWRSDHQDASVTLEESRLRLAP
jgi:hypothetical protein